MLKFYLVTDTHYYSTQYGLTDSKDQKTLNESGAIIDSAFETFIKQDETDILLVAGDITCNGRAIDHKGIIEKLQHVKDSGKRVFVITATHDYGLAGIDETGESERRPETTYRGELRGLYNNFGFSDAIAEFDELSYVAQLAPGYRLLCLNDDGNGRSFCGYGEEQLNWILEQIQKAKDDGQYIFAMTHHPCLPPSPIYPKFSKRDMLGDYENTTTILADAGLRFIFTGHTHMQNINMKTTEKGNKIYDINTGSLVGFPAPYRVVSIDDTNMYVNTRFVESIDWDLQGKTLRQYLSDHFDSLLNDIFYATGYDIPKLAELAGGFSVTKETVMKFRVPIKIGGKIINKMTLGNVGTLLLIRRKIDMSVRKLLIKNLIVELVRNVYEGDEPYSKDTPQGAAILAIAHRIDQLVKPFIKNPSFGSIHDFVAPIIYDDTPDNNAVLPLYN